jgi:CheY-like chemotaxis protein
MPTKTILIIEDDDANRDLFRDILEEEGFAVIAVSDAADAFSLLSRDVDLVLLDLVMPRAAMDGFTFLSKAHTHTELGNTPVVVLSGLGASVIDAIDPRTAGALRIVAVVPKPVDIPNLVSLLRSVLGDRDRL